MLGNVQLNFIETLDDAMEFKRWLGTVQGPLGFDTESTGLNKQTDRVRLAQFGDAHTGWAIDFDQWKGLVREVISAWSGEWVMHNAKFDVVMMENHGIEFDLSRVHDTRYMCHILNPLESTALKTQARLHVDRMAAAAQGTLDDIMASSPWSWADIPIVIDGPVAAYWIYGALDPVLTRRLFDKHYPRVAAEAPTAYDVERSVAWVVMGMEKRGVLVDREYTLKQDEYLKTLHDEMVESCQYVYGVSPSHHQDVAQVLLEEGLPLTERTNSGGWKMDADTLQRFAGAHGLVDLVLKDRKLVKLQSTYTRRFLEYSEYDGRIHPNINTIGGSGKTARETGGSGSVRTGRMSMDSPNLQQLPRGEDELASIIRNCVIADEGNRLVMFDFDQVEMRIFAHLSGDERMRAAFNEGDFFTGLAAQIYHEPGFQKKDPRRTMVKSYNYATLYGAGIEKLAHTAKVSFVEMVDFDRQYNQTFPGVKMLKDQTEQEARAADRAGYGVSVRCPLTGRYYMAEDVNKAYTLLNHKIQGMAAFILKSKLLEMDAAGLSEYMVLPVHDEIISNVPKGMVSDYMHTAGRIMNDETLLSVPLTSGAAIGERWGEKKDVDYLDY